MLLHITRRVPTSNVDVKEGRIKQTSSVERKTCLKSSISLLNQVQERFRKIEVCNLNIE